MGMKAFTVTVKAEQGGDRFVTVQAKDADEARQLVTEGEYRRLARLDRSIVASGDEDDRKALRDQRKQAAGFKLGEVVS